MIGSVARLFFGTRNDRVLNALKPAVYRINDLERRYQALSDDDLRGQTAILKERHAQGETLDSILPDAFAVAREASKRVLGMRHFDVQLIGGMILHQGKIAEMKTGEGKTLVATLPAYLNALSGKGVHVVTVNDYLAKRDAEWMGRLYKFLGFSVGVVVHGMNESQKRGAYAADITYGQNNEFGFDYLRDNMRFSESEMAQRGHNFAIVDEVDSILVDEARTPLIISGPAEDSTEVYYTVNKIIPKLVQDQDFAIELKTKQPSLTDAGITRVEELLGVQNLYDPKHIELLHHVNQGLKAYVSFQRDVDYVVKDGQVIIVDEFTGRLMPGRRWSDGIHQAIEAKEGLRIARENRTLASVTFQNYFRMYSKLSGMTGTADTEAVEFKKIYNLEVILCPPNRRMVRADLSDKVYRSRQEKYEAVVEDIAEVNKKGQPVLVGTISIEQSESLSKLLQQKGVPHNVLNAKQHEREAEIIAQAGRLGAVTISTNMAGRGTDILLGGNPEFLAAAEAKTRDPQNEVYAAALKRFTEQCASEREKVREAGGLYVLGTERHESRRIDNQLRGRSGRQGDPGLSRFYISLEDDLMRRFGGERIQVIMNRLGWDKGAALDGRIISHSIETAQQRVEGHHFEIRKHLLEYDDVLNKQRHSIYELRRRILASSDLSSEILAMSDDLIEESIFSVCVEQTKPESWDLGPIGERFGFLFNCPAMPMGEMKKDPQEIFDKMRDAVRARYSDQAAAQGGKLAELQSMMAAGNNQIVLQISRVKDKPFDFTTVQQDICLEAIDHYWLEQLQQMTHLREGIGLRGYGQKNPLYEYQREGFLLFQRMLLDMKEAAVRKIFFYDVPEPKVLMAEIEADYQRRLAMEKEMELVHDGAQANGDSASSDQAGAADIGGGLAQAAGDATSDTTRARLDAQRKARRKGK